MTAEGTPAAELAELLVRGFAAASVGLTPGEGAQPRPRSSVESRSQPWKQKPSLEVKPSPKLLAAGSWAPLGPAAPEAPPLPSEPRLLSSEAGLASEGRRKNLAVATVSPTQLSQLRGGGWEDAACLL